MGNLVIWEPNPLLVAYAVRCKKDAISTRERYARKMVPLADRLEKIFNQHTDVCREVKRLKNEIQLQTRGIPATEAIGSAKINDGVHQQNVANAFLLKKAYKLAAALAHPDKGGSHDDFVAINAAYRAGDLKALNEYVLSLSNGLLDQIGYWITEIQKPEIDWVQFQSSDNFRVIQLWMQGRHEAASDLSRGILDVLVLDLLFQLNLVVKENHGTHQESSKEAGQESGDQNGTDTSNQGSNESGSGQEGIPSPQDRRGSDQAPSP